MKKKIKLQILSLVRREYQIKFKKLESEIDRFFYVNHIFDDGQNLKNYLDSEIGILFIDIQNIDYFQFNYYSILQKTNPSFLLVAVSDKRNKNDYQLYKGLMYQIIYMDDEDELLKWNVIAIVRRYWNVYSKPTTVIYKNIIADFVQRRVQINNNPIQLTNKEFELLKVLIENRGKFIGKKEIFKKIWGYDDEDSTRALDQIIFKLKSKIGDSYFQTKRVKGIKFE